MQSSEIVTNWVTVSKGIDFWLSVNVKGALEADQRLCL